MSDPAVTVLMTVFNAGRHLDASIRSIVDQAFRNFEFVIVDDASTDGSLEVAKSWARRDARLRVVENSANKGQTRCLNQGLREARGKWVARQDADDLSHPARLAEQFQFTTMFPDVVLLGTNGRIIDKDDHLFGLLDAPLSHAGITWTAPFLNPFIHTSVLFRTDVVREEFGGYDESYRIAQDYELWTRVIARHKSANLAERLVCYRHLGSSLSKAGREQAFAEARAVSEREAGRAFSAELSSAEHDLLASFREGLQSSQRRNFWKLYHELFVSFLSDHRDDAGDLSRTQAAHHLKASGALLAGDRAAAAGELLAAFRAQPFFTFHWLWERYFNA